MKIRSIEEKDIENCANLFARVFSGEPWSEPWTEKDAFCRLNHFYRSKGFFGTLIEKDRILGFALGNWEPFYFGNMFYIREMCTDTEFQSQGIGGQIYSALESELVSQSIQSIYLTTERDIPAANFYKKQGFHYSDKMGFYAKDLNS
jgi:ribosomal protein S18 acetylase RimI-like enzyme